MISRICHHCGTEFQAQRKTRKFCSRACANRAAWASEKERECQLCGQKFPLKGTADANRRYCSQKCSKKANAKRLKTWQFEHPEKYSEYYKNSVAKNPSVAREKSRRERAESIRLLGGGCVVCGVTNPNWLHVDYIPTTRNKPYRHPRHLKYIREHLSEFRLLCANHHYELTITGAIEGTDITQ